VGYLGQGLLNNVAAIVMCNEIISYVKRIIRGFDMSREKMALDVIRQVGPGGHYLAQQHTKTHFLEEFWQPLHVNRDSPDPWAKKGALTYEQVVTRKAIEILGTYEPNPLPEEVLQQVREIAARGGQELAKIQFIS
jgi:trimethylamine--corrinoid protein Co-methyltransferase